MLGFDPPRALRLVRALLATLLVVFWSFDVPQLVEMFGAPLYPPGRVAQLLWRGPHDAIVVALLAGLLVGALLFGLARRGGVVRVGAALVLACDSLLLELNGAIRSPEYPLVRLLLVGFVLSPADDDPTHRRGFARYAWFVVAGATFSAGITKLLGGDPAWSSGHALSTLLSQSVWVRAWAEGANVPAVVDAVLSHGALILEASAPLVLLRWFRPWWWGVSTCMHLGALLMFSLPQVSLGMLWCHLLLFVVDDDLRAQPPFSR